MFKTLQQPFPKADQNMREKVLHSFWEGLGVYLFFVIFQPFGISVWKVEHKFLYLSAYGFIVFGVTLFYRLVLPTLFPAYFEEKKWVVWKEIIGVIFILAFISFLILFYHSFLFENQHNDFRNIAYMVFLVMVIGSVPIVVSVLGRFAFLYKKYSKEVAVADRNPEISSRLVLVAENEKDTLEVEDLLYIESADNYCMVFFMESGSLKKELIRSSLTRLENQISDERILRCHRSYIVNFVHVKNVTGNAQGYKLTLQNTDESVPVARKYSYLVDAIRT